MIGKKHAKLIHPNEEVLWGNRKGAFRISKEDKGNRFERALF